MLVFKELTGPHPRYCPPADVPVPVVRNLCHENTEMFFSYSHRAQVWKESKRFHVRLKNSA